MPTSRRRYWLWVTKPEFYLDEDGNEREDLDPSLAPDTDHWWTCHKDTKEGDLVFLYRTTPRADIAYLLQARTDAFVIEQELQIAYGWSYRCEIQVLFKLASPIMLQEMHADPYLESWSALRGRFQKSSWLISESIWAELVRLASESNADFSQFFINLDKQKRLRRPKNERQLEDKLAADLSVLSQFGYDLELKQRQYICGEVGRIDLLCFDRSTLGYVVIELKDDKATRHAYGQIISYMSWVQTNIANGEHVDGLVISRGYDIGFDACLRMPPGIHHVDVSQL